ncbi:MAG: arsenite methyltransferase [Thermoplasmata archaeon]
MTARRTGAPTPDTLREGVRERYGKLAAGGGCCGERSGNSSCCGGTSGLVQMGYDPAEIETIRAGADLGLGCGNPTALLSLRPGEVVLDLGSGAGIDCFLAAKKVGPRGLVIGVDMTPEMVARARRNAREGRHRNVEFRLGEIEHLPVPDGSVDAIISNCVINLAPDQGRVYREAFRTLRPGGRLAVSDVVATRPISKRERADPSLWESCFSGAIGFAKLRRLIAHAGFEGIEIDLRTAGGAATGLHSVPPGVYPASIRAVKPAG